MKFTKTVFLMVVLLCLPMVALAQGEKDPILTLPVLVDGDAFTDSLTEDVTTRLYAFNANEGDVVTISVTQVTEGMDPYIVLLGPAGQVIAADDDGGQVPLSSLISEVAVPQAGSYFILVSTFQLIDGILAFDFEGADLDYDIAVAGMTAVPETDEAAFEYFSGDLIPNTQSQGFSTIAEPVFFYTFQGTAGQVVDIEMSSDEFDTLLYLFSPGGERIAINDDFDGTNSRIMNVELPETGLYLIFATDVFWYNVLEGDDALLSYTGGDFTIALSNVGE
ncbi:MAG: PPC domain-containing protein [Chloroflexota bacterium]